MVSSSGYDDDINNKIFNSLADVFQQAQSTYAGHRKHIAVLKKIQIKASQQGYSDAFNYWFNKLVTRVLPLKKNEVVGDRIIKLVAAFIASLDRENEIIRNERIKNNDEEDNLSEKEKTASKFIDGFIRHILRGIESKDKNVRFRVTQMLVVIMDNIGEIDEELYTLLMWSLNKRIYDKEPFVRIQAVFCLTKFQSDDTMNEEDEMEENKATETLIHMIQNDPSAEVRRAAMLNIINNETTRAYILERARDINPINRRLVYSRVLRTMGKNCFDEINSRIIDQLLEWGLGDREERVRIACQRLISNHWINLLNGDLIELLEKLDISNSQSSVNALESLFKSRSDIITKIKFTEEIWSELTVEISFLFRCFYIYCLNNDIANDVDDNFPEASRLSEYLNIYIQKRYHSEPEQILSTSDKINLEFIIEQLLITANKYDNSDEIGRRSMLNVIRNMLRIENLSDPLIKCGHEVLKNLSINERDFISMTLEIINDIRDDDIEKQEEEERSKLIDKKKDTNSDDDNDNDENDENDVNLFHSAIQTLVNGEEPSNDEIMKTMRSEKEASPNAILLCLTRASRMLALVTEPLNGNILISSLIDTLITPAVRNSESTIRELGVKCLGLCCLLDIQLAIENLYILGMCISKGNATLKSIALQVLVDIFSVHGASVVDGEGRVDSISIHKIFYKVLKNEEHKDCQVIAAEGLCKLYLADVFTDDDLFEALILSYFSPINSTNEALIQAFAFCIPVYCFSHKVHQHRMNRIASDILLRLCILWDELQNSNDDNVDKNSMLRPNIIFQQLVYWTDPRKIVNQLDETTRSDSSQLNFLTDILKVISQIENKNISKMILMNINTFYVTPYQNASKLREVLEFLDDILDNGSIDAVSRNSLEKFKVTIIDTLEETVERTDEQTKDESRTTNELTNEQYSQILETSNIADDEIDFENGIENVLDESSNSTGEDSGEFSRSNEIASANLKKRNRTLMEDNSTMNKENISPTISHISGKNVSFALLSDSNSEYGAEQSLDNDEDIVMSD